MPNRPAKYQTNGIDIGFWLSVIAGACILLLPALYNGYPLMNTDDGTYLWSGFFPGTPVDRPIAYGLFIRLTSLNGVTLFLTAIAQCLLVSCLILKVFSSILAGFKYRLPAIISILLLSFCSSVAWISSEILPDVCTSIALLSLYLIMLQKESRVVTVFLFFVYTLCIATHMSHLLIFSTVLLMVFLFRKKLFQPAQLKVATYRMSLALVLTISCVFTMGYAISQSKHVFAMGALLEQGVLTKYLDVKCPTEHYKICNYKDVLAQNPNPNYFLWSPESPLYVTGGWEKNKTEYSKIVWQATIEPQFAWLRIKGSLASTWKQALEFGVGDGNVPFKAPVEGALNNYIKRDLPVYQASRQYNGKLLQVVDVPNILSKIAVVVSVITLLLLIPVLLKKNQAFVLFAAIAVPGVIINTWVCATFAQINGRYGCRAMWLLPLTALLSVWLWKAYREERKRILVSKNV